MTNKEKQKEEQIGEFLTHLDNYISCKIADATADSSDSYTGMGVWEYERDMERTTFQGVSQQTRRHLWTV